MFDIEADLGDNLNKSSPFAELPEFKTVGYSNIRKDLSRSLNYNSLLPVREVKDGSFVTVSPERAIEKLEKLDLSADINGKLNGGSFARGKGHHKSDKNTLGMKISKGIMKDLSRKTTIVGNKTFVSGRGIKADNLSRKEVMLNTYTVNEQKKINEMLTRKCKSTINDSIYHRELSYFPSQWAPNLFTKIGDRERTGMILSNEAGTGKTLSIIKLVVWIYKLIHRNVFTQDIKIVYISYTGSVFKTHYEKYHETGYLSTDLYLKGFTSDDVYSHSKKMDLEFYGYKKFGNKIIEATDVEAFNAYIAENAAMDHMVMLLNAEKIGLIKINYKAIASFSNTVFIFDESHKMLNTNKYGLAALLVRRLAAYTIFIYMSASIVTGSIDEFAFVQSVILDKPLKQSEVLGPDKHIIPNWKEIIVPKFEGYILYSGKPKNQDIPDHVYVGNKPEVRNLELFADVDKDFNFVFVPITDTMRKYTTNLQGEPKYDSFMFLYETSDGKFICDKNDMAQVFKNPSMIPGLKIEMKQALGIGDTSVRVSGSLIEYKNLEKYSPILKNALNIMFYEGSPYIPFDGAIIKDEGKILIHTSEVNFPGAIFIGDVLIEYGAVPEGEFPTASSRCYACLRRLDEHPGRKLATRPDGLFYHDDPSKCPLFKTMYFVMVHAYTGPISPILERFNHPDNDKGEILCIIIATRVLSLSHSLKNTKYLIDTTVPEHVTNKIQFDFRIIRSGSMNALVEKRAYIINLAFYDDKNPLKYTRQMITIAEKFSKYKEIRKLWKALRDISADREIHESTQTSKVVVDHKKINSDTYYTDGYAIDMIKNLMIMIRQLFNVEGNEFMTKDAIVDHIINKKCIKTRINTQVSPDTTFWRLYIS